MGSGLKKRKALAPRERFEILKRDGFACAYCGAGPPGILLEVDHIIPVRDGGTNDASNLVTACATCNGGKGAVPLTASASVHARRAALASALAVAEIDREYNAWLTEQRAERRAAARRLAATFNAEAMRGHRFLTDSAIVSIEGFLSWMTEAEIMDAIDTSIQRVPVEWPDPKWKPDGKKYLAMVDGYGRRFRYLCGICHNKRRSRSGSHR